MGVTSLRIVIVYSLLVVGDFRSFIVDYEKDCFLKDGEEFRYVSGGFHYFRVPKFYWKDRLLKMKSAGLNAVQSYIAWNIHEPSPGQYNFDGDADIESFIEIVNDTGLLLILRPGPYICSEWDFGGFPAWLLKNSSILLRSSHDKVYMDAVSSWMRVLLNKIEPYLYSNGGPVISLQVENEYGEYFTCDLDYLKYLQYLFEDILGKDKVVLFTVNPASDPVMKCGTINTLFSTVDFGPGDNITATFELLRKYQPHGPLVNTEFYTGWLDNWGKPHETRPPEVIAQYLEQMLQLKASVNMYMFEGGTNFGFMNGANHNYNPERYQAQPTSYDYDAPLSEAGDITEKFYAVRKVIGKYLPLPPGPIPPSTPKHAYGKALLTKVSSLGELLNDLAPHSWTKSKYPLSMEILGFYYGFVLYKTTISLQGKATLDVSGVRDRAVVYLDMIRQGILDRNNHTKLVINGEGAANLLIMVENQGRINGGPKMNDPKGIIHNVTLNKQLLVNWEMAAVVPENNVQFNTQSSADYSDKAGLFHGNIPAMLRENIPQDSYLLLKGWHKGQVYINNFNLGRYWPVEGPQVTLYVPASVLRSDNEANRITVFELDESPCEQHSTCYVQFTTTPIINGTVPAYR